jgi:hypothetical protein
MKYTDDEETLAEVLYMQTEKNDRAKKREEKLLDKQKNGHMKKSQKRGSSKRNFYDSVDEDYETYLRYGIY